MDADFDCVVADRQNAINPNAWWPGETKPSLRDTSRRGTAVIAASDAALGDYFLHCEGRPVLLFTENETNNNTGTKAAAHYQLRVGPRATAVVRLRLSNAAPGAGQPFGAGFAQILEARRREADEFYRSITPAGVGEDAANATSCRPCGSVTSSCGRHWPACCGASSISFTT